MLGTTRGSVHLEDVDVLNRLQIKFIFLSSRMGARLSGATLPFDMSSKTTSTPNEGGEGKEVVQEAPFKKKHVKPVHDDVFEVSGVENVQSSKRGWSPPVNEL